MYFVLVQFTIEKFRSWHLNCILTGFNWKSAEGFTALLV